MAMTDHGNIYGAVHFFNAAKARGIKPILGCELYICKEDDHRGKPNPDLKYNHLLVLAENEEGYRNLVRLTSEAALHGFYRKPRVSKAFLAKHPETGRPVEGMLLEFRELVIEFGQSAYVAIYHYDGKRVVVLAIRHGREAG